MGKERLHILLGGLAAVALGGFLLYDIALRPAGQIILSRGWTIVPCLIESSGVRVIRDGEGDHRTAGIRFSYDVGAKHYESMRHDFWVDGMLISGADVKLVKEWPAGSKTVCYVNPDDPADVVLSRTIPLKILWGVIPAILIAFGLLLIVAQFAMGQPAEEIASESEE